MAGQPKVLLLASHIEGAFGGVPMLNQLILGAAERGGLRGSVVAFVDTPGAAWQRAWPDSSCASGSRARLVVAALRRAHRHRGSTILATHLAMAPIGRLVKMATGGRLVVMLLGAEALAPLPAPVRWAFGGCDLFVSISACTLTKFLDRNPGFRHVPSEVCHLPARTLAGGAAAARENGALRVMTVGRLFSRGMEKGQRQLIRVWPRIQARFPGAELYIVGGGNGRAELRALAEASGVSSVVHFPGGVSDEQLAHLYDSADVFAMPSRHEGFGLVFAEAMSRGVPCIASRIDAGAEVVTDGETGLLVDPDNLEEVHDAIVRLLGDPALRRTMAAAARLRATEAFSQEQFDRRMLRVLSGRRSMGDR